MAYSSIQALGLGWFANVSGDDGAIGRTLVFCILAFALLVRWLWWASLTPKRPSSEAVGANKCLPKQEPPLEDPLRWSFLPSTGILHANTPQPEKTENDFCTMKVLAMHRPTHMPWRDVSGSYPYSWHMGGRKRIWEIRLQVRFKRLPKGPLYFGLEMCPTSKKVSVRANYARNLLLQAIRGAIGHEFYQSSGDDPVTTDGEAEPPTFAMPLWAIDQFHVARAGEEPDITGNLDCLGVRRTDGLTDYIRLLQTTMDNLDCDNVYTFCVWGVSRFVDVIKWELCGLMPGFRLGINNLCHRPPINVCMYELPGVDKDSSDKRHLVSRKQYLLKVALWSALQPAPSDVLRELIGSVRLEDDDSAESGPTAWAGSLTSRFGSVVGAMACCTGARDERLLCTGADARA